MLRRRRERGQSVTEFAILFPLLLALLGVTIDVARVFQSWITLNSAVRDAAEMAATTPNEANATANARRTVCLQAQGLPGFVKGDGAPPLDLEACTWPSVTVTWSASATAPGATETYPIGTATVTATFDFVPLFNYPIITNDGVWNLSSSQTYSVIQNR